MQLASENVTALDAASADVATELGEFAGVFDILTVDDLGEQEFQLALRPQARSLDISLALLAIPLNSHVQPLVIMSAIPFGVIGALIGHAIVGVPVGLFSLFGILGLTGVVVNDTL